MSHTRPPAAGGPPHSLHARPTESAGFPDCLRAAPCDPFAARWAAKRDDHDRFVRALDIANGALPAGWRLPDELVGDWIAAWADDLFIGIVPRHDRMSRAEVAAALGDVTAVVEALGFVERYGPYARAQRFWFHELASDPGLGPFPAVERVQQHRPELDPRGERRDGPSGAEVCPRCDQRQFFERAFFLLGTASDEQLGWIRRLAWRLDPHQPLWSDPPNHHVWACGQVRRAVPALSRLLGVSYPQLEDEAPIAELIRRVHNWIVQDARPALTAFAASDDVAAGEGRPGTATRAKASTVAGEARAKLVAALTVHHRYAAEGGLSTEPIGSNALAELAGVQKSTASEFFKREFGGHQKYKSLCHRNPDRLHLVLRHLNGELPGAELPYGRAPDSRDET